MLPPREVSESESYALTDLDSLRHDCTATSIIPA